MAQSTSKGSGNKRHSTGSCSETSRSPHEVNYFKKNIASDRLKRIRSNLQTESDQSSVKPSTSTQNHNGIPQQRNNISDAGTHLSKFQEKTPVKTIEGRVWNSEPIMRKRKTNAEVNDGPPASKIQRKDNLPQLLQVSVASGGSDTSNCQRTISLVSAASSNNCQGSIVATNTLSSTSQRPVKGTLPNWLSESMDKPCSANARLQRLRNVIHSADTGKAAPSSSPSQSYTPNKELSNNNYIRRDIFSNINPDKDVTVISTEADSTNKEIRTSSPEDSDMNWSDEEAANHEGSFLQSPTNVATTSIVQELKEKSKDICIVIDTNIFLKHLKIIKDIIEFPVDDICKPIIYIPWMVVQELDFLKEDNCKNDQVRSPARKAVKLIHNLLSMQHDRVRGQTVSEADKQVYISKDPDDKILSCCLQAVEEYETVILLSQDINLKNKALIHNIATSSDSEIMVRLHRLIGKSEKVQKIKHKLTMACSFVICECAKEAYDNVWNKMALLKSGPWSLNDCMKIFQKYWTAVFSQKLLKHFLKAIEDLEELLKNKYLNDNSSEFKDFVNLALAICIMLKDVESTRGTVQKAINEIQAIRDL